MCRKTTERPETIEYGSNFVIDNDIEKLEKSISIAIDFKKNIIAPLEYLEKNVSHKVIKILISNHI